MNSKKSVLYILLSVLGLILFYNAFVSPFLARNSYRMGMHGMMYAANYNVLIYRLILFVALAIGVALIYLMIKPKAKAHKCITCGKEIRDGRWKICPFCGTSTQKKRG